MSIRRIPPRGIIFEPHGGHGGRVAAICVHLWRGFGGGLGGAVAFGQVSVLCGWGLGAGPYTSAHKSGSS